MKTKDELSFKHHVELTQPHSVKAMVAAVHPKDSENMMTEEKEAIASPLVKVSNLSISMSILTTFMLRITSNACAFMVGIYLRSKEVNAPLWTVGIVITCFYITELLLAPLMGALSDRKGRKIFMVLGPAVGILAVQIHPLTTMVVIIMAGRLLEGVAAATAIPATLGYLSDVTEGNQARRGRIMTFFEVATVVGIAMGQALGGPLWDTFGRNGFRLLSIAYLVIIALTYFLVEDSVNVKHAKSEHGGLKDYLPLLTDKHVISFVPAWLALNAIAGSWLDFVPSLLKSEPETVHHYHHQLLVAGYSGSQASMILLVYGVAFAVGMGLWSLVFGKIRKTTIMLMALAGLAVASAGLLFLNSLDKNDWRGTPVENLPKEAHNLHLVTLPMPVVITLIVVILIGIMFESGFTPAALAHLADISSLFPEKRGALMGLYSVLLGVGQLVGGWLGGPFAQIWGFNGLIYLTCILMVISFVSVMIIRRSGGDFVGSSLH